MSRRRFGKRVLFPAVSKTQNPIEVLSDFQIIVPEIGTIRAEEPPMVIVTSNRTQEVHYAPKRRCLYHCIDYPNFEKEFGIVLAKVPAAPEQLARQVVAFVQELRQTELYKRER